MRKNYTITAKETTKNGNNVYHLCADDGKVLRCITKDEYSVGNIVTCLEINYRGYIIGIA